MSTSNKINAMALKTKINKIKYSGKYNPYLRPISHKQITTVEISPSSRGKTFFYKDSRNTVMLMLTNALVRQHKGAHGRKAWIPFMAFLKSINPNAYNV